MSAGGVGMSDFQIGIMVESLRLGVKEGIKKAAELGADGIQIFAVNGEMHPDNLSSGDRKELLRFIKGYGLKVSALCGDFGGHGFQLEKDNRWKIEQSKKILELAVDLDSEVVTTHIGMVPQGRDTDAYRNMVEACSLLSEHAGKIGAWFAVENRIGGTPQIEGVFGWNRRQGNPGEF